MNEDNRKKLAQAAELRKGYVANLLLPGKSGRDGLATMLSEGFRCGIRPKTEVPVPAPAVITCIRDMSFLQGACSDVSVSLFPKWAKADDDIAGLFKQLDRSPIEFASVFCPYKDVRSEDYLQQRTKAGAELGRKIIELNLERQRTDQAFETLLIQGFSCGFATAIEQKAKDGVGLACTRVPSRIDFCYHARLTIELKGHRSDFGGLPPLQAMQASSIATVHSACDLPLIEGR